MPADELQSAQWGHDVVLHHRTSGLTHFVNLATAVLLRDVLAGARTLDAAAHALAETENAQADERFLSEVAELMQRLESLGLVERVAA